MPQTASQKFPLLPKAIVFFTIFLDALGIGFITPILPFYVKALGLPDIVVSFLFVTFSLFAFFSAPLLGSVSDRRGRRPVLIASLLSSALGWVIFAVSRNAWGLFLGRIIDGAAAGNISTAQNYLADISKDQKDLTKNLGTVGAIFGIGFILSPLLGGFIFNLDKRAPFFIVGLMAVLNALLVFLFLPETNERRNQSEISLNPLRPIIKAVKNKKLLPLFLAWFFFGVSVSLSLSILGLYVGKLFLWGALTAGLFMTMVGVIAALNQAFLIHKVWLRYFKESSLMVWMIPPFALGYFAMALPLKASFILGLIVAAFAYSTLRIITNSQIIGLAEKEEQGEVMGVLASLISLALILGPMVGGPLYEISLGSPFILTGILLCVTFVFVFRAYGKMPRVEHIHTSIEVFRRWLK